MPTADTAHPAPVATAGSCPRSPTGSWPPRPCSPRCRSTCSRRLAAGRRTAAELSAGTGVARQPDAHAAAARWPRSACSVPDGSRLPNAPACRALPGPRRPRRLRRLLPAAGRPARSTRRWCTWTPGWPAPAAPSTRSAGCWPSPRRPARSSRPSTPARAPPRRCSPSSSTWRDGRTLLDVGGGSGAFSIALCAAQPAAAGDRAGLPGRDRRSPASTGRGRRAADRIELLAGDAVHAEWPAGPGRDPAVLPAQRARRGRDRHSCWPRPRRQPAPRRAAGGARLHARRRPARAGAGRAVVPAVPGLPRRRGRRSPPASWATGCAPTASPTPSCRAPHPGHHEGARQQEDMP